MGSQHVQPGSGWVPWEEEDLEGIADDLDIAEDELEG